MGPTLTRPRRWRQLATLAQVPEEQLDAYLDSVLIGGRERREVVIADYDGVVVLPQAAAEEAIRLAEEKVRGENMVREHLAAGMPVGEAFRRFGVI